MCYNGWKMADAFKKLYDDLASRKGEANAIAPYAGGNGRVDRAVELIRSGAIPASGTMVDVGGATGNLGYALRDLYGPTYVVDIADACRVPAHAKGSIFVLANVDAVGLSMFSSDTIGLIVALDFIEHILDPEKFARECFRVLRPGGFVLLNTPNIQYWRHLHSLVVDGVFPHTSGDMEVYHGGHVGFYNYRDLALIFEASGFTGQKMHTEGLALDPPPPIWRTISNVAPSQLSVADLVFSAWKPE